MRFYLPLIGVTSRQTSQNLSHKVTASIEISKHDQIENKTPSSQEKIFDICIQMGNLFPEGFKLNNIKSFEMALPDCLGREIHWKVEMFTLTEQQEVKCYVKAGEIWGSQERSRCMRNESNVLKWWMYLWWSTHLNESTNFFKKYL